MRNLINLDRYNLEFFVTQHVCVVYFFRELVAALHKQGTDVYLVSGGFKRIIQHPAEQLQIPAENIFANRLLFDDEGTSKDLPIMTFI